MGQAVELVFWVAFAACVYAYLGYPVLLTALCGIFGRPHRPQDAEPSVSLIIPAHNESQVIRSKIENALALDYPGEKLQVLVVSDGSDDGTDEIVREYAGKQVELHRVEQRAGKANALNVAVPKARGEILLLCDANTMFRPDAVRRLVRHFGDPDVGAVTGDVRLRSHQVSYGEGEGLFYRMERFLQKRESWLWTAIGVDGGMFALRRGLYVPNRPDVLIDDFALGLGVVRQDKRIIYDPEAIADEDAVEDTRQEFRRRSRTIAGGFQTLFGGLARPRWNQPGVWFVYLSHKVLRWFSPFLLLLLLFCPALAMALGTTDTWRWWFHGAVCAASLTFCLLGLWGMISPARRKPTLVGVPFYFLLANAAALAGFAKWLLGLQPVTWRHVDRKCPAG